MLFFEWLALAFGIAVCVHAARVWINEGFAPDDDYEETDPQEEYLELVSNDPNWYGEGYRSGKSI